VSSSRTESLTEVRMPQMGVSVAEGTILEWRKRPGDWVKADETLCDVSTDKVDVEIPAPAAGRLERILVEPGETVPVGTPLAEIDSGARPGQAHRDEHQEAAAPEPSPDETADHENGEVDRSRFHSPIVRRIAEEHGVDLAQVTGTGIGGRVRKKDLLAFIHTEEGRPEPVLHMESPYQQAQEREHAAAPGGNGATHEAVTDLAPGHREPMSVMRQAIARHMVESRRTAAHCTTVVEVDLSRVAARRAEQRDAMERRGVKLTYLAFVARATVEALERFPVLNASVEEEDIVYHDDVNLGIAVALEQGLIVPVIRQAQRLSLEGLAAAIGDLAERARTKRLEPDDVHGGTFTITNPGQFGAILATPIINQPQVAILDLEAIVKRPVVVTAEDGTDSIAIRPMTYLCMSWDHRALDGADATRFMGQIKHRLEGWEADR
jgi:2-oxoglutarate dehydrogenase complex dihydrolipoamide succinyltransferase (E2) component